MKTPADQVRRAGPGVLKPGLAAQGSSHSPHAASQS